MLNVDGTTLLPYYLAIHDRAKRHSGWELYWATSLVWGGRGTSTENSWCHLNRLWINPSRLDGWMGDLEILDCGSSTKFKGITNELNDKFSAEYSKQSLYKVALCYESYPENCRICHKDCCGETHCAKAGFQFLAKLTSSVMAVTVYIYRRLSDSLKLIILILVPRTIWLT